MSEMIERVTKALQTVGIERQNVAYSDYARAAIEAMRTPTPAQEAVMWDLLERAGMPPTKGWRWVWNEMISAALSEEPKDITVRCKCGWQGCQSNLDGNYCPTCAAPFKAWPAALSTPNTDKT